ncbi:hypothetical protein H4R34_001102 [Dimargaris verticillata]|uniref:Uncharacterized protein n=1 Tax=Dimargaris verticillata TaxID=2761393 RepID=A0A9W8B952_9FUNG|nr:hypothetical protein H4R34_001102 [Dimargaris verticillata]
MAVYTYLAALAVLALLPGQWAFTASTVRIEDGNGHCITQPARGTVEGTQAILDNCSPLYPKSQVILLNPHPSDKDVFSIVVGNQCVSVTDKSTENRYNVTYAPCADDKRQYFRARNQDNNASFESKKHADKFLLPLEGALLAAPKDEDNTYPWQLFMVGGGVCSDTVYDNFIKSNASMVGLMRKIGLNADQLLQTIDSNGMPSLQLPDQNILNHCDTQIQWLFSNFTQDLTNMFAKASQFNGTYRTQIQSAVSEVVQALQEDKLTLGQSSSDSGHPFLYFLTNSVVGPFLGNGFFGNAVTSALKTWALFSDNKSQIMTENPEKNAMVGEVSAVFDQTSSELFNNLRHLITNSTYDEFSRYVDEFATKSVDAIYGDPTALTHKIKLQVVQYAANATGTLSNQLCLIGQDSPFKTRRSDFDDNQGNHFILEFPANIKRLTLDSLQQTNQTTAMLQGKDGWNLKLVDDSGFLVRSHCDDDSVSYDKFYNS